jgi:transcriptional regulator with XRE-family HTH domain
MTTLQELRQRRGFTQMDIANVLRVTPVTVHLWEKGVHRPHRRQVKKLCKLFQVLEEELDLKPPTRT